MIALIGPTEMLLILLSILIFGFWIWMLISAFEKPKEELRHACKLIWVIVIIFTGIIGAILYYFLEKR